MKYYSEILNKNFDTVEDLEAAEKIGKERVIAKTKEDAALKAEIDAAKKIRDDAKADYCTALNACHEALSRWNEAEKKLSDVEAKNRSVMGSPKTSDEIKRLVEKWFFI